VAADLGEVPQMVQPADDEKAAQQNSAEHLHHLSLFG
jgi:hypothetical protein